MRISKEFRKRYLELVHEAVESALCTLMEYVKLSQASNVCPWSMVTLRNGDISISRSILHDELEQLMSDEQAEEFECGAD